MGLVSIIGPTRMAPEIELPEPDPIYRRGNAVLNGDPVWPKPSWGHGVFNGGDIWPRPPWVFGTTSRARSDPEPEPYPIYRRRNSFQRLHKRDLRGRIWYR